MVKQKNKIRTASNPRYERFDIPNNNQSLNQNNESSKNLPYGWVELFDSKSGKPYYLCKITKHTQWLNPTIPLGKIMQNGLPYGWEKEKDPISGEYYYINHVVKFTTWNPPIKQRRYLGEEYTWDLSHSSKQ